ncbi:hypothetical protein HPB51_004353 [Rhipicephalus microplus]|uniref:Uncharacterized protein n=1 Tax=Rhipicephalus microplus TaxID=6941 RepID=A0A9J6EM32_RHIMP|nr:hypothetical protein HPB51_004353 [Rhipicephalus microplus]
MHAEHKVADRQRQRCSVEATHQLSDVLRDADPALRCCARLHKQYGRESVPTRHWFITMLSALSTRLVDASRLGAVVLARKTMEPGTEADIKKFVQKYNVKFDMFSKVNVNGDKAHPLWKYLKQKQSGFLTEFTPPRWSSGARLLTRRLRDPIPAAAAAFSTEAKML